MRSRSRFEHELETLSANPKRRVWQRPASVDEALELFQKARAVGTATPPDEKRALEYVGWVRDFLLPLVQPDVFDRQFPIGGGKGSFRDAADKQAAWGLATGAFSYLSSVRAHLSFGGTVGGLWPAADNALGASRYFLEVLNGEGVSSEVRGVPPYRSEMRTVMDFGLTNAEVRFLSWMKRQRPVFDDAEKRWRVDRRAIAGVIAWEALDNRQFFTLSSVGPGKIHVRFILFNRNNFAKQVETAGYLPAVSETERNAKLAVLPGAVLYTGAIMRAGADIAWRELGVDLYGNPEMLAWIYNAQDLEQWKKTVDKKKASRTFTFQPLERISKWIGARLFYLERGVGKPQHVLKPTP